MYEYMLIPPSRSKRKYCHEESCEKGKIVRGADGKFRIVYILTP